MDEITERHKKIDILIAFLYEELNKNTSISLQNWWSSNQVTDLAIKIYDKLYNGDNE